MLSPGQEAVSKFLGAAGEFKAMTRTWPDDSLSAFADAVIHASAFFGETEFYARQADRCAVLKLHKEREMFCRTMVKIKNAEGLQLLAEAPANLKGIKKQVDALPAGVPEDLKKQLRHISLQFADLLVDSHLKPADVGKIHKLMEETLAAGVNQGAPGVYAILEGRVKEYHMVRQKEDRGAVDNIPYWKYVAVALFLGVAVMAVIHCYILRACSSFSMANYAAALLVLALIAIFC